MPFIIVCRISGSGAEGWIHLDTPTFSSVTRAETEKESLEFGELAGMETAIIFVTDSQYNKLQNDTTYSVRDAVEELIIARQFGMALRDQMINRPLERETVLTASIDRHHHIKNDKHSPKKPTKETKKKGKVVKPEPETFAGKVLAHHEKDAADIIDTESIV